MLEVPVEGFPVWALPLLGVVLIIGVIIIMVVRMSRGAPNRRGRSCRARTPTIRNRPRLRSVVSPKRPSTVGRVHQMTAARGQRPARVRLRSKPLNLLANVDSPGRADAPKVRHGLRPDTAPERDRAWVSGQRSTIRRSGSSISDEPRMPTPSCQYLAKAAGVCRLGAGGDPRAGVRRRSDSPSPSRSTEAVPNGSTELCAGRHEPYSLASQPARRAQGAQPLLWKVGALRHIKNDVHP